MEGGFEAAGEEFELSITVGGGQGELDAALGQLSEQEREVLLARVEGYEPSAAARLLGISAEQYGEQLAAVRVKLCRAIGRLRKERERDAQNREELPPVDDWLIVNRLSGVLGKHPDAVQSALDELELVPSTASMSSVNRGCCSATRPSRSPRYGADSRPSSSYPTPATG